MQMSYPERFRNRTLLIATMHGKEKVIAPIIENALGISTCVSNRFNTDELGTFTGEIKRKDDPLTTLRKKCELALDIHGADLVIGNEGSFGPHPGIFFLNADDELVMLIDRKHGLEIVAREVSTETNFAGQTISSHQELMTFAKKTGFPSHALILRDAVESRGMIVKGITDENQLTQSFDGIVSKFGSAYVETDMRAMFNPTRMKVIKKATEKLIAKLHQLCPECDTPGFDIDRSVPGLPCSLCGRATLSTLYHVCACKHCKYEQQKNNRHGKTNEDPMYCPFCNP
jgi:hypothetical protein